MNRRQFVSGIAAILASQRAPWVCSTAGVLMPVRDLWKTPPLVAGNYVSTPLREDCALRELAFSWSFDGKKFTYYDESFPPGEPPWIRATFRI